MKNWESGLLAVLLPVLLIVSIMGFSSPIKLVYMYWGSPNEQVTQMRMVQEFMKAHPGIIVQPLYVPGGAYNEKLAAMVAAGDPPEVAQVDEVQVFKWAESGVVRNILPLIEKDKEASSVQISNRLPMTWYWYDHKKKTFGTNLAAEVIDLWYNKNILDKEGVPYPSATTTGWTWDKFVQLAIKLTLDNNGKHPGQPGFNPKHIKQWGVALGNWWGVYLPFIWSNGGDIANKECTVPEINKAPAVKALQMLANLIYKYHVAPSPSQYAAFHTSYVALESQRVAMVIDGQWALLDYGELVKEGRLKLGVAPLPTLKKPICLELGSPNAIFTATTKSPEVLKAAWEFYKWTTNSAKVMPLLQAGLWMPLQIWYYTNPKYLNEWINNKVHPSEYKEAVVNYLLKYGKQAPSYYMKNWAQISDVLDQGINNIMLGRASAQKACDEMAKKMKLYLAGRW